MSADVLRRAATQMRERAEAADSRGDDYGTCCWLTERTGGTAKVIDHIKYSDGTDHTGQVCVPYYGQQADHIASWHPAVALAVADWLDVTARDVGRSSIAYHAALDVARAYLGGES